MTLLMLTIQWSIGPIANRPQVGNLPYTEEARG